MKKLETVTIAHRSTGQPAPGFSIQSIPLRDEFMIEMCLLEKRTGVSMESLIDEAVRVYFAYRLREQMRGFHGT